MKCAVYACKLKYNTAFQLSLFIGKFYTRNRQSDPEVIKLFSCLTQLSMKFFLFINVEMPKLVGILIFMSGKNSILGLSKPKKAEFLDIFILMSIQNFHAQLS